MQKKNKLLRKCKFENDPIVKEHLSEEIKKVRNEFRKKSKIKKLDNVVNGDDPPLIKKKNDLFQSYIK